MMMMNWTIDDKGHLTSGWRSFSKGERAVRSAKSSIFYTSEEVACLKKIEAMGKITKHNLVAIAESVLL